ncbi:helix-turn-helix domain-containing protein [Larkinella terrae]|uniref:Helix-turn-helix domain-containing protein n=1 Tax=Larkinella terrae TaxID=2025311 RepID=A0A7K0EUZ7_9BACT|nr:AraC family transcriptional regulator [Larkinella terrae]MRS65268.1 helix-turn-helix domain-containing protein [Larkinella terrae]
MKPQFEKIEPEFGSSCKLVHHIEPDSCWVYWHYHPEYEIVYIPRGNGKRHIGHHVSSYQDGELVFLGPNLPHLNFGHGVVGEFEEIVVQLREDFLGKDFLQKPELAAVRRLFDRSHQGMSFFGETKQRVGRQVASLVKLPPFERMLALLTIFQQLAVSTEYQLLNAESISLDLNGREQDRINRIYGFVEAHFSQPIDIQDVASLANMTVPAFCRYFKKMTLMTFTDFVNEFRITQARKLLAGERSIGDVCYDSGFNNLSHFNKVFKQRTGQTPGMYRRALTVQG